MIDKAFQMPGMNASGLPSGTQPFADMSQGLAWMQNMWSSYMNSPMAPTLDIDELDRRIKDLKAVEQWLSVNQALLRTTIQGLEIQRAGMAGLRAMMEARGEAASPSTLGSSVPQSPPKFGAQDALQEANSSPGQNHAGAQASFQAKPGNAEQHEHPAMEQATQWWGFLQKQFEQLASHASLSKTLNPDHVEDAGKSVGKGSDLQTSGLHGHADSDKAKQPGQNPLRQTRIPRAKTRTKAKPGTSM